MPTSTPIRHPLQGFHDGVAGFADAVDCNVFGWIVDPDNRKRNLQVQVLFDDIVVATTTAVLLRSDVGACTAGTCGFRVALWGLISAGDQHRIAVQA